MKGIHLPNRETTNQELSRIVALGCTDYVDLDLWPDRWKTLKSLQPGCKIHIRIYSRGTLSPNDDARACAILIENHSEIDTVRIRNEPNIETLSITPEMWMKYLDTMLSTYKNDKLSLPAMSPGLHGWETYFKISADAARAFNLKQLDAHIYGNIGEFEDILYKIEGIWQGDLLITEHNFGAGKDYRETQWAQDYCNIIKLFPNHPNIKLFSEFIWEWYNPDIVLVSSVNIKDSIMERTIMSSEFPIVFDQAPVQSVPKNYSSPNTDGKRKETKLIVLHGTRGGFSNLYTEWIKSFEYLCSPDSKVSVHAIVGVNEVGYPIPLDSIAWHARELNDYSIGVELVQPFKNYVIPTKVLDLAARVVADICTKYNIPVQWDLDNGICEHFETIPGIREGKTDIGNLDHNSFLNLVNKYRLSEQRIIELRVLPEWYLACIQAGEDWTLKTTIDFVKHLKAIGADWKSPEKYGWK